MHILNCQLKYYYLYYWQETLLQHRCEFILFPNYFITVVYSYRLILSCFFTFSPSLPFYIFNELWLWSLDYRSTFEESKDEQVDLTEPESGATALSASYSSAAPLTSSGSTSVPSLLSRLHRPIASELSKKTVKTWSFLSHQGERNDQKEQFICHPSAPEEFTL